MMGPFWATRRGPRYRAHFEHILLRASSWQREVLFWAGRACWIRYKFLPALPWTPWGPSFRFFSRIFGGVVASSGVQIRAFGVPEHPQSDTNPHPWLQPEDDFAVARAVHQFSSATKRFAPSPHPAFMSSPHSHPVRILSHKQAVSGPIAPAVPARPLGLQVWYFLIFFFSCSWFWAPPKK